MEKTIYTIGMGNRGAEEFLNLLRTFEIEMAADVRSVPESRFSRFCRQALAENLGEAGIGYVHLGKALGGRRPGGFEVYTQTYEYLEGLEFLERLASRCRLAILCAERLPERCHRRFIARNLEERGWTAVHILGAKPPAVLAFFPPL